ncbi:uncharacterized protein EDB91DRAFT_1246702 [Suillus paluster]|uniref:uncharacterized protein n=1 Tax=Suillus paluster TaxID=48578 RepID=UPI001B884C86|nr:uncharacterized protein EDB91DRAFT_1246702 [Suillus paluster]KAG1744579.1 hypothetical protein EDB91DRAFT_1246702 [Suillus paluster]
MAKHAQSVSMKKWLASHEREKAIAHAIEDAKWLERNEVRRQEYKEELRQWEEERAKAKLERQRMTHVKLKLGRLEAPLPKPALTHIDEEEDESNDSKEEY